MITKPKGTYDILPNESGEWANLEVIIKEICSTYNYKEIRTPIFESFNVFHRNENDTSDMVTKETYDFKDRSDRMITLRPEGTAGVARSFVENKLYVDSPLSKLYYMGPMFRYERPQKGRNRQFNQFGVEALGSDSPLIDVEVIALGASLIKKIGLPNVKVKINTLGDEESRTNYRTVLVNYFSNYKDCLCQDCLNRLEKNPLRILDCKVDRGQDFFKLAPKINEYLNDFSKNRFDEVLKALNNLELDYEVDLSLVRGLDYYSHTVFELEVSIDEFGAQNVIGAGGRYDQIIFDLGGPKTPGVGMAFGLERLLLASKLTNDSLKSVNEIDAYVCALGKNAQEYSLKLINELRQNGLKADMDFLGKGLKAQFKQADKNNSLFTLILGDNELENNQINIKNNKTDNQETISLDKIIEYIKNNKE